MLISEIRAYGDVVLRFLSRHNHYNGHFLPTYQDLPLPTHPHTYGLERLDHAVGNVYNLLESVNYMGKMTGFHEFAEFTAEDVGTLDSGLNSVVLANNEEEVLLPLNEPTYGTKRKSQIQTYLEYNNGPGLQHLALATNDIFTTLQKMRDVSYLGGFEFMERPAPTYYQELPSRIGGALTEREYEMVEELGLLADKDDQGVLLQIFTKPVGDRPTLFLEIIQRIGCVEERVVEEGGGEKGKVSVCMCVCMCVCVCIYMVMSMCRKILTPTHTHIHTYTHTNTHRRG
jgi:4-hydroxyphenylpyruvate dioxygenase